MSATNEENDGDGNDKESIPVISCPNQLLRYGVVAHIPIATDRSDNDHNDMWTEWARTLSQVTPAIMTAEGDGEYAFYRNILDEPDFPFEAILDGGQSAIAQAILKYFNVQSLDNEIRLDDAFCIHYDMSQTDTRGAKHMDPSDITVNMCLEKSDDCQGSHVLFYGTKRLAGLDITDDDDKVGNKNKTTSSTSNEDTFQFLVPQEPGYATLHWGNHPHATTRLEQGHRTNIVITYCYTDKTRSDVGQRDCYNV